MRYSASLNSKAISAKTGRICRQITDAFGGNRQKKRPCVLDTRPLVHNFNKGDLQAFACCQACRIFCPDATSAIGTSFPSAQTGASARPRDAIISQQQRVIFGLRYPTGITKPRGDDTRKAFSPLRRCWVHGSPSGVDIILINAAE